MDDSPVDAVLIHAVYLLNCASEDPDVRAKSLASLTNSLRAGQQIGAAGVVLHPGSAKKTDPAAAIARAGECIREALAESEGCPLHLENTAGAGGTLGRSIEELADLLDACGGDRGSGCAWIPATCSPPATTSAPPPASTASCAEIDAKLGLERLGSLHLNDSRCRSAPTATATRTSARVSSARRAAQRSSAAPAFEGLACVLETPGASRPQGLHAAPEVRLAVRLRTRGLARR